MKTFKYKHKEYKLGISVEKNVVECHRVPLLDRKRYRGRGRPRKDDYQWFTWAELIDMSLKRYEKQAAEMLEAAF